MSNAQQPNHNAAIQQAQTTGLVATRPLRSNAGNLMAPLLADVDDILGLDEDDTYDCQPSEPVVNNNEDMLVSSSSEDDDVDSDLDQEMSEEAHPCQDPSQLSEKTMSRLSSGPISPLHPALMALAQATSAFSRAHLADEANTFRTWTIIAFDMAQYSRALVEMGPLPEHSTVQADVELAEEALMDAEIALREEPVDGVGPGEMAHQVEKYVKRKITEVEG